MSWEGHYRLLCGQGHLYHADPYYSYIPSDHKGADDYDLCSSCQSPAVWLNIVDETNGSFDIDSEGRETDVRIDGFIELTVKTEMVICTCACGDRHLKAPETYHIPPPDVGIHLRPEESE
jgi:hypothetical protein